MRLAVLTVLCVVAFGCRGTNSATDSEALTTGDQAASFTGTVLSASSLTLEADEDRACIVEVEKTNKQKVGLYLPIRKFADHTICDVARQLGQRKVSVTLAGDSHTLIKNSDIIHELKSANSQLFYLEWTGAWTINIRECADVSDEKSARSCMLAYGRLVFPEGEDTNSVGLTKTAQAKSGLKDLLTERKAGSEEMSSLESAVYVGVLMQHFDEDQITYFALSNGKNVEPTVLFDQNMVDISFDFPKNVKFPDKFSLFLPDIDGWHYEDFKELANGDF